MIGIHRGTYAQLFDKITHSVNKNMRRYINKHGHSFFFKYITVKSVLLFLFGVSGNFFA